MSESMKAVRIHAYGGPEVLTCEEAPRPTPESGQVLVRVKAAGVNPFDAVLRSGAAKDMMPISFPYTMGFDFAGIVEEAGADVSGFQPGQAVYGQSEGGAYAEYVAAPAATLAGAPHSLDPVRAASVPMGAMTAWESLFDHAGLQAGQTILIHGAAGSVGMFAVQFARWKGARVLATASGADLDFVTSLGADQVIDYQMTPFEPLVKNVDAVLDVIGGDTQKRSLGVLKPGGILVATTAPPDPGDARRYGVRAEMMQMKPSSALLTQIADLIDAGQVRTDVGTVLPLAQARQAHEGDHPRGKVVLQVS